MVLTRFWALDALRELICEAGRPALTLPAPQRRTQLQR
jgi:hypothetical protein